jgi:flagellar assembly factor FliW
MQINTVNFGELEVPEEKVIHFKEGIPGFPAIHRFAVLALDQLKPFHYLQALDDPPIALYIINPFLVHPGYEFQLGATDMEELHSTDPKELAVYVIATIPENADQATLNLMAPIIINEQERRGKQIILTDSKYSVRHPLITGGDSRKTAQGA